MGPLKKQSASGHIEEAPELDLFEHLLSSFLNLRTKVRDFRISRTKDVFLTRVTILRRQKTLGAWG